ncbi:MAG: smalltalk protein [Oscillospiraceae bacterium]|nr:smalltalk protein [Oscillospiraceae bacterium]
MNTENDESKKKSAWDLILKVIIAVASALAGVLGGSAMNL